MRRLHPTLLAAAALLAAAPAPAFELEQVQGPFDPVTYVTAPPGDTSRLFVVEKRGVVRLVHSGALRTQPFLDISADVHAEGEGGLGSIAFPPDYATTGRFYVVYTAPRDPAGVEIVVEERRRGTANVADAAYRAEVLRIDHPREFHYGGQLQFGPDGHLWLSTGDSGEAFDPDEAAQDPHSLLGKLLRIDPTPGGGYDIPADNPFADGTEGAPEVWALGLRNAWRFSFDRQNGDLYVGDVGQHEAEEIDRAPAPDRGRAANYGWLWHEGDRETGLGTEPSSHAEPWLVHTHDDGWKAITGGYVIRDASLAEAGSYVYGDFGLGQLWLAEPDTGATAYTGVDVPDLTTFGEDAQGRVYAGTLGGDVFRLVPGRGAPPAGENAPAAEVVADAAAPPPLPAPPLATSPLARAPRLAAGTLRRQRALRRRRLFVRAGCDVGCTVTLGGRLSAGTARFRLAGSRAALSAGERRRLTARIGRRAARAARRALRRGAPVRARLTVRATGAGGTVTQTLSVGVRR